MNNVRSIPLALKFPISESFESRIIEEDFISFLKLLLRLHLDVDIEKVGIELISISNLPWYCIGPQFEFYYLDEYALPFGIFATNPFPFLVWIVEGIKIEFY
jgi:hypothetical protein